MDRIERGKNKQRLAIAVAAAIAAGAAGTYIGKQKFSPDTASPQGTSLQRIPHNQPPALSERQLDTQREKAIKFLTSNAPKGERFAHLHDADFLRAESTMYLPDASEQRTVRSKSESQLQVLATATLDESHGFFAFADVDSNGKEYHRLYVMRKDSSGILQFVKGYKVSMGEKGFGNRPDSGQTPTGLRRFQDAFMGLHGEVVDATRDSLPHFRLTARDAQGKIRHFVSTFNGRSRMEPAAVVTGRLTIDLGRGIHFHVSNRSAYQQPGEPKRWISMLGGPASGACGRMAGADFADAFQYVQPQARENGKITFVGTPIFIHATEPVMERSRRGSATVERSDESAERPERRTQPQTERQPGVRFTPFNNNQSNN